MPTPKAQQTSLRILKAAAELFEKYGYYNVSIKEIADLAQSNSALISYYFGGKEKLYQKNHYHAGGGFSLFAGRNYPAKRYRFS